MSPTPFISRNDVLSWGRVHRQLQEVAAPRFCDELPALLDGSASTSCLAIGLRRSYGDSCLNSGGAVINMGGLDRLIAFDETTGMLRAESGASLSQILAFAVPRGWFLPTTPGSRFVTLGGAIANDVHGKNHHQAGSFGCHVSCFGLLRSDGSSHVVTKDNQPRLFAATIGGIGLTGVIEWAEIQLQRIGSAYLDVEIIPYVGLDEFWTIAEESVGKFEHTVSWIDCSSRGANFGRGIFSRANWREDEVFTPHDDQAWKNVPFDAPAFLLNRFSVAAFNELYFRASKAKTGIARQHYAPFFYPLDAFLNWNRLYGRRGMFQYQCVIPADEARVAITSLLDGIARSGQASFLSVLKTFGERASPGLLSFPRPGVTLAIDFPNRGVDTLNLLSRLDVIVSEAGGALYPAKDGRLSPEMFRRSFPRWREFLEHKDPIMNSDFWRRVAE
ncbi:FAD-binding oxidoreductase [Methylocystis sp. H62]|uniref:FAD-binding oxidoreductase n=1 Tax=Methylocystis sp. H62 TaxID=2785789 RepID=UPI001AEE769F|nr:FAD-binding oxidoreductase [Methylocystis sp. H62]